MILSVLSVFVGTFLKLLGRCQAIKGKCNQALATCHESLRFDVQYVAYRPEKLFSLVFSILTYDAKRLF